MINPVGIAIGASLYLSLINISLAASYDVDVIAEKPMTTISSASKNTSDIRESFFRLKNTTQMNSTLAITQSKPNSHLTMTLLTLGLCYLVAFRRRKAKLRIFF